MNFGDKVSFIWSVADLLRGPYKPAQYGRVILPLTVLRRLDCVLEPTKDKVLAKAASLKGGKVANTEPILNRVAKASFHNTSKLDFPKLKGEPDKIAANLTAYIKGFSSRVRDIMEKFNFEPEIARLDEHDRLFLVVSKFADIDLHPDKVSNIEMGYIFEELIRRFNEAANETAGDHFTPREVIRQLRREVNPDAEELRWSDQELLEALGAVRKHQSQFRPTIAGLLLFGTAKALRQFFPMMRIDYIRVPGVQWVKDPDRRFDTVEIRSPLIRAIQRARAAILDDLPKAFSLPAGEVQGQEIPVLPDRVVREVVANAVMHRSYRSHGSIQIIRYANRLEIRNPGYSLKAEERLGEPGSETRNPKIAAVLHEIKFAETKGSGIRVMRELMAECNLSPPVFQSDRTGNSFLAILLFHHFLSREDLDWLATFQEHGLAEDEMKALISAREVGAIDNSSYRDINRGVDTLTASKHLKRLCQFDLLRKKGQGSGTYYVPTEKLLASWNEVSTRETASESPELAEKPSGFGDKSSGLAEKPSELDSPEIRSTGETSKDSVIENSLPPELAAEIADLGGWAKKEQIRELVLKICSWRDLSLPDLSRLLGRSEGHLRQVIISPMVKEGLLQFTIPDEPSHPRQRYRTAPKPPTVVDEGR